MKEENLGAKEANERRPEAQKGVAHAARFFGWPHGAHLLEPRGSVAVDLFAHDSLST